MTPSELLSLPPRELDVMLAKLVGINVVPCTCTENPWKDDATGRHVLRYSESLDAVHEVEKTFVIGSKEHLDYTLVLAKVSSGEKPDSYMHWSDLGAYSECISASALYRTVSLILTLQES